MSLNRANGNRKSGRRSRVQESSKRVNQLSGSQSQPMNPSPTSKARSRTASSGIISLLSGSSQKPAISI